MKSNKLSFLFCCVLIILICSCVRKPKRQLLRSKPRLANKHYLYLRNGIPFGVMRVECNDCQITYIIGNERTTVDVKTGNEDRFIYPKPNSSVKTILKSFDNQMIRVLAVNPNGKIVSNVLDTFVKGQKVTNKYPMQYIRLKNTVVIDILKKKQK